MPTQYHIFSNSKSGSAAALSSVKEAFKAAGVHTTYHVTASNLGRKVTALQKQKNVVLVVAGGDGTVNAVVNAAAKSPHPVGVLPLGTLNHFAKDIGMPTNIQEAVTALVHGKVASLDVATVNNHLFVNNSSIGLYPSMVTVREQHPSFLPKWIAGILASLATLSKIRRYHIQLTIDGKQQTLRSPFVFIGNNQYKLVPPNNAKRTTLTRGELDIHIVKAHSILQVIRDALIKRPKRSVASYSGKSVTLTLRRKHITVAYDGEVSAFSTPLTYHILPKKLRIIIPK